MSEYSNKSVKVINKAGPLGFPAILAYIGAAVYFIEQSGGGFWEVILALLQAIVWPVYFVYHVLGLLGA
jgi:hypothetical protein